MAQVTSQDRRVHQMNYKDHMFTTKASHLVGGYQLWSNLERDEIWHMITTDEGEWRTAQYMDTPTTRIKCERREFCG